MAVTSKPPERTRAEPPQRRPPPVSARERRTMPAGMAMVVVLVALAVSAVLNAQGMRKTASIQEEGWMRDVGLAVTRPIAAVSHWLQLDEPRQGLKEAIGRGDDDKIQTEVVFEPPPALPGVASPPPAAQPGAKNPPAARPKPAPKPAFSPKRPLTLWVAGDSLSIVPGQSILQAAGGSKVVEAVGTVDGRLATGLERPDVFNWFTHIRSELKRLRPRAVVLTFGANDDHSYMTGVPDGVELGDFGSPAWIREYRRRVGGLMDTVVARKTYVVWIGLPQTRSYEQTLRYRLINRIYRSEAQKRAGWVFFINTDKLFQDENGDYADYLPNAKGELIRVRSPDGVHFERSGGDVIAREIFKRFNRAFDLTSWRKRLAG